MSHRSSRRWLCSPFRDEPVTATPEDTALYPTVVPGEVDPSWLDPRAAGSGNLSGTFCSVTASDTLATLHAEFVGTALSLGLGDFDAAALKDARGRPLTQSVATYLYVTTPLDGIRFASRHGDDLPLWAVFERPGDPAVSPRITQTETIDLSREHPAMLNAFEKTRTDLARHPDVTSTRPLEAACHASYASRSRGKRVVKIHGEPTSQTTLVATSGFGRAPSLRSRSLTCRSTGLDHGSEALSDP